MKQTLILHSFTIPVYRKAIYRKPISQHRFRPVKALQALSTFLPGIIQLFFRDQYEYKRALLNSFLLKVLYQYVSALHALVSKTGQHLFFLLPPK